MSAVEPTPALNLSEPTVTDSGSTTPVSTTVIALWMDSVFDVKGMLCHGYGCYCAYVGIPITYRLPSDFELDVHGGVTFDQIGGHAPYHPAYHWLGWDYGHFLDAALPIGISRQDADDMNKERAPTFPLKYWTEAEVKAAIEIAIKQVNAALSHTLVR